jgi:hypothetical protein
MIKFELYQSDSLATQETGPEVIIMDGDDTSIATLEADTSISFSKTLYIKVSTAATFLSYEIKTIVCGREIVNSNSLTDD